MIVCCGEALIDMLPRKLGDGSDVFLPVPGGAIFNTAISLGRLGTESALLCGISLDMFGEQLIETLEASNVDCSLSVRTNLPTTLAFVKLVDGSATYLFYDENSALQMLQPTQVQPLPKKASVLHFGCISLISEPCGATYEQLLLENAADKVISIDPNIRPGFINDEVAYRGRLDRMIAKSNIIKVSDEDLAWIYPGKSFQDAATRWIANGASLVVLTMGEAGAWAIGCNCDVKVPSKKAIVVDTVGAGDTFNAGLMSALQTKGNLTKFGLQKLNEVDLEEALDFASAVAAYTVSQQGANSPWKHQL
jgi:fructokinase